MRLAGTLLSVIARAGAGQLNFKRIVVVLQALEFLRAKRPSDAAGRLDVGRVARVLRLHARRPSSSRARWTCMLHPAPADTAAPRGREPLVLRASVPWKFV